MSRNTFEQMKQRAIQNFANVSSVAPGILPGVKWNALKSVKCNCGAEQFHQTSAIKLASPLQTTKNIPTLVQLPVGFQCAACGNVNDFDTEVMEKLMPIKPKKPVGSMKSE